MSSPEQSYSEKRDFIRMKINSPVAMKHNGTTYKGVCKDLSGAGMLISTEQAFDIGDNIEVFIEPSDDTHMPFKANAEITRIDSAGSGFIIGISISQIL